MTLTNNYKKKLIEVAIPLEAINAASIREKSIRHGHPSTLHLWWARRPLAACRAVLFAQLVDDPSSNPFQFDTEEKVEAERQRLFDIIKELVIWDNSTNDELLERARSEIRKSCGDELPPVYDPFSGGGSIPLEAQRLGLPAFGSDLNPVAVLIGKAMIEIPPKFKADEPVHSGPKDRNHYRNAEGLAEDVKFYGEWMRQKAVSQIGHHYPPVALPKEYGGGEATAVAWIWARTVPSPDPAFSGVRVPIASSFLLGSKSGKEAWVEPIVNKAAKTITYKVRTGANKPEIAKAKEGTKAGRGANFRCIISDTAITPEYVKSKGQSGEMGQALIAIVADGKAGRVYVDPNTDHESIALSTKPDRRPETMLPNDPRNFWTVDYGLTRFGDLFTDRQLVALNTFSDLVHEARVKIESDALAAGRSNDQNGLREGGTGAKAYAEAISIYLGFAVSKASTRNCALAIWEHGMGRLAGALGRQTFPMQWTFAETNPLGGFGGDIAGTAKSVSEVLDQLRCPSHGSVTQRNAAEPSDRRELRVISTDPPYYDNIEYADLSDFFYVWMRSSLGGTYPDLFGTLATPKADQLVASPHRHGGKEGATRFFLDGMSAALRNIAAQSDPRYPSTIYYAFKQSEIAEEGISSTGWATFLEGVVASGLKIVGTWPVRTEATNALKKGINALANSVVLVCRNREASAETISRAEFIRALKRELPAAIGELQAASIAPADMPQSAIGPGMGIFSRYTAVLESDDSPMSVKAALQLINRELDEYLGGIQGEFDADTRFAITWFEQHGSKPGEYGSANSIAQARGISVESVKHAGIVDSAAGKVRIIGRDELDADWDPAGDGHLTVWECCQHLIRALETDGEHSAAMLLKKIGSEKADAVKDLAYCLYGICEKRSDAKDATSYNALIAVWTELTRQAAAIHDTGGDRQTRLDL